MSLYQIVGIGSLNLEPNLYYVSVYGFSLLLLILREKKGGFKKILSQTTLNIVYHGEAE